MSPTNAKTRRHSTTTAFTLVELIVSVSLSAILFAGILGGFTFLGRNLTRLVNTQEQDSKGRHAVALFSQDISGAIQISQVPASPVLPPTDFTLKITVRTSPPAGIRTGKIDAFTSNTLSNASAGWTSNLADPAAPWLMRITSGPFAGKLLDISANTTTTLTVNGADLTTLGLTAGVDTFELANAITYRYTAPLTSTPGRLTRIYGTKSVDLLTNLTELGFNYFNNAGDAVTSDSLSVKEVELTFASAIGNLTGGTQAHYAVTSPRLVLRNKPLLQ